MAGDLRAELDERLERTALSASDHVLVHGGVGGVGHIAVQLAKAIGVRVATTIASSAAAALASSLGADETINYRDEKVEAYVDRLTAGHGFDVVFDTIGGNNLQPSFAAAAETGRVASPYRKSIAASCRRASAAF